MKKIIVERGMTVKLARIFCCTDQCVRNALRGATESELSQRIRKEALKQGGFYKPNLRKSGYV